MERLTGAVDEPSPRRIKTRDPAKIENDPARSGALRKKFIRPGLDRRRIHRPVPAQTQSHGIAQALAGKFRAARHLFHPASASIATCRSNKIDINGCGLPAACGEVEANP